MMGRLNMIGGAFVLVLGLIFHIKYSEFLDNVNQQVNSVLDKFKLSEITESVNSNTSTSVVIAYVACGTGVHLEMLFVSIKSAVIFSQVPLHFVIISDQNRQMFSQFFSKFQSDYNKFVSVTFEVLPPDIPDNVPKALMEMYRPCASYRLYFPITLPHHSKLIYLDTDTIWLESPSVLWDHFSLSPNSLYQVAQDNRDSLQVQPYSRFPGLQPAGLGSGVMLMNLDRMRHSNFMDIASEFLQLDGLILPDQTFIGSLSRHSPHLYRQLPAKYNVQPVAHGHVTQEDNMEDDIFYISDIVILHGSCKTFLNQRMFQSWTSTSVKFDWSSIGPDFILGSMKWSRVFTFPQPVYLNSYQLMKNIDLDHGIDGQVATELEYDHWRDNSNIFNDNIYLTNGFIKIVGRKLEKLL